MPWRAAVPIMERTAANGRPPVGTEAAGDLAIGCGGAQFPFASVVVGCHLGMVEEGEQVIANLAVSPARSLTVPVCGSERHDGIKRAIQPSAVFAPCALGQIAAAPGNHHGAQQQRLHPRGEDGIPGFDGELTIAQLVRQADLPLRRVSLLGAVKIGNPDRRTVSAQHLVNRRSKLTPYRLPKLTPQFWSTLTD